MMTMRRIRNGWVKKVQEAEKRGTFTEEEKKAAKYWSTCAVGEEPISLSSSMMSLGYNFEAAIRYDDFARAKQVLEKIRQCA